MTAFRRLLVLLSVVLFSGCTRSNHTGFNPGDNAPTFVLPNLEGENTPLEKYRGKVVLLNFWASWCQPCVEELPALERLYSKLKDQGLVIVAIGAQDTRESLTEFRARFGLSYPVLFDEHGEVSSLYKSIGFPESFFLDRQGRVILFPDPADNMPVVRIIGPRPWDSPQMISRIKELLAQG